MEEEKEKREGIGRRGEGGGRRRGGEKEERGEKEKKGEEDKEGNEKGEKRMVTILKENKMSRRGKKAQ